MGIGKWLFWSNRCRFRLCSHFCRCRWRQWFGYGYWKPFWGNAMFFTAKTTLGGKYNFIQWHWNRPKCCSCFSGFGSRRWFWFGFRRLWWHFQIFPELKILRFCLKSSPKPNFYYRWWSYCYLGRTFNRKYFSLWAL